MYREAGANIILHNLVKIRLLHQTRAKKRGLVKFFASIEWRSCSPMVNEAVFAVNNVSIRNQKRTENIERIELFTNSSPVVFGE